MAGWVPGILMCVLLMLAVTWSARRFGYKPEHDHPAPLSEILKALLDSIWAILFPVLLIVLIRFGIMSPPSPAPLPAHTPCWSAPCSTTS